MNDGATPLFIASQNGHAEVVSLLLGKEGVDVNQATNDGATPLYIASQEGHAEVVSLLLGKEGVDVNQATNDGATPLFIASQNGHAEVVSLLLGKEGIDVNQATNDGATPLYHRESEWPCRGRVFAAGQGRRRCESGHGMMVPRHFSSRVIMGHAEVVSLLLGKEGVDVNQAAE